MASQSFPDPWPTYEIQPVSSRLRELYSQAICIAVDFLNCEDLLGSLGGINILERAEIWAADYYGDARFCTRDKRSELTSIYPDLLDTTVDCMKAPVTCYIVSRLHRLNYYAEFLARILHSFSCPVAPIILLFFPLMIKLSLLSIPRH